jgi:hypothetical protein
VYYCIENGFIPSKQFTYDAIEHGIFYELPLYFHNKLEIKITTDIMNKLLNKSSTFITTYGHSISIKTAKLLNFGYSQDLVDKSIINGQIDMYTFCKLLNVAPNEETLRISMVKQLKHVFDDYAEIYKITPDADILRLILDQPVVNLDMLNSILCYKILPTKKDFEVFMNSNMSYGKSETVVELMIKHGLQLDLDDIKLALKHKLGIKNLERFNIPYDEKLYYWCYIYDYYPYDDMNVDNHIFQLRKLCRNSATSEHEFIQYMENNKIMPDRYCFDHACRNNKSLRMFFVDSCDPTLGMYYWSGMAYVHQHYVQAFTSTNTFLKYVNAHNISEEYMRTQYDIDIKKN